MFLQRAQGFFSKDRVANLIAFVGIDGYDLFGRSLRVGVLGRVSSRTHEQSLHLPRRESVLQLFWKLCWIGGGVKRFQLKPGGRLVMTVIVGGHGVVSDDYIGTKFSDLQNHATQTFFVSPELKRFVARFRITKILQTEKVWL